MSRKPDITWQTSIVIDKTIQYDTTHPAVLFDYDTWVHHHSHISGLANISCVDALVKQNEQKNILWLVEVKDYRTLTQRPRRKNLEDLDQTLAKKLAHTLNELNNNGDIPQNLYEAHTYAQELNYVIHIEPHPTSSPYIPSGFPLDQYQAFLSSPERNLVTHALLRNAAYINQDDSLPWQVTLFP